jgi:hypothetical protein
VAARAGRIFGLSYRYWFLLALLTLATILVFGFFLLLVFRVL